MNWGLAGIVVVFLAFVILLIINPNLSCFGRKLKSPFYPLFRKKTLQKRAQKTAGAEPDAPKAGKKLEPKTEDYGFRLD